jgi:ketosteroid isomerase-like protein
MDTIVDVASRNKIVVRAFYEGAVRGDICGFGVFLHTSFVCCAPNYLPWGGDTHGAESYLQIVLPQMARVLDFSRFSYQSMTAEDDHVVAVINVGVMRSSSMIKVSEHWVLEHEKARSVWMAYYEPAALVEAVERDARSLA